MNDSSIFPEFELALIVDESKSMVMWEQSIAEYSHLLSRLGAFRDVQVWKLATDADKIRLYKGADQAVGSRRARHSHELIDPTGQRLILLISDCVASAWYNGQVTQLLATWVDVSPVALIQVLPQQLWRRTALGKAIELSLYAPAPHVPNRQLQAQSDELPFDEWPANGVKMPIVTLEPESLALWARMITGAGVQTAGFLLDPNPQRFTKHDSQESGGPSLSPMERLQRFNRSATPIAYKLATYFAAVPLTLPVMRLVQHTMLPESRQVHLAEVFLSGLLKEVGTAEHPDNIRYDFVDGVRQLLLNSLLVTEAVDVLRIVSDFIAKQTDQSFDFQALIGNPTATDGIIINEDSRPFATMAAQVLRRFGGPYLQAAKRLEQNMEVTSQMNLSALREQLNQMFDDPQLDAFCMDHFPSVYDRFGRGMRKDEKISLLLDDCRRTPERAQTLERLLSKSDSQEPKSAASGSSSIRNPKPIGQFDFRQKKELVNVLLACPSVSERERRQTIINELRPDIRNNFTRSSVDRVEVMNLVNACLKYDGGLDELIWGVRFFEGDSIARQKLDQFIEKPSKSPAHSRPHQQTDSSKSQKSAPSTFGDSTADRFISQLGSSLIDEKEAHDILAKVGPSKLNFIGFKATTTRVDFVAFVKADGLSKKEIVKFRDEFFKIVQTFSQTPGIKHFGRKPNGLLGFVFANPCPAKLVQFIQKQSKISHLRDSDPVVVPWTVELATGEIYTHQNPVSWLPPVMILAGQVFPGLDYLSGFVGAYSKASGN